jgi:hypothetical protein
LWYIEQEPELFQTRGGNCDVADDDNEMNDGMGNRNVTELVEIDEDESDDGGGKMPSV